MKKPDIIYVTPCWPHGKPFGSQLRILHVARALQQIGRLRLVVVDWIADDPDGIERTRAEFQVECYGTPRLLGPPSWKERLRGVMDPRQVNPYRCQLADEMRRHVFRVADQADLVWFSYLKPMSCFDRWSWPHSVMDIDDIPSTYERTLIKNGDTFRARLRARWHMRAWQRRERRLWERFTVLAVSSEPDRAYLRAPGPVHLIPNVFERPSKPPHRAPAMPPRLGFIGQFSYPPNAQGIRWFVKECWPLIKQRRPDVRLRLVGNGSDGPLKPAGPDIDALGWVPDAADEIASWDAMIVPVLIGAGTRVKVLEAFSRKCPVVSTRIGVFGHNVHDGDELFLGDTPADFAQACLRVVEDPSGAAQMAERAWRRFLMEWTAEAAAAKVGIAVEDCLERSGVRLGTGRKPANVS